MANKIAVPESALYYNKGVTAYVNEDGVLVRNAPSDGVLVRSSDDFSLPALEALDPGTLAYTAGFKHMWQKGIDGTWVQIV